jgi:hypothetical protein
MKRNLTALLAALLLASIVVGCGGNKATPTPAGSPAASPVASAAA